MPLVRISLNASSSLEKKDRPGRGRAVGDAVHAAMVEALGVPDGDHFQVIAEHSGTVVYDPSYLGIDRSDGIVIIEITLAAGRSVDMKAALYKRIADLLEERVGVRRQDVFINLVEVTTADWSFGNGEAQFAYETPPHLQRPA